MSQGADSGHPDFVWVYRCDSGDVTHDTPAHKGDPATRPDCPTCGRPTQPTIKRIRRTDPRIDPKTGDPRINRPM